MKTIIKRVFNSDHGESVTILKVAMECYSELKRLGYRSLKKDGERGRLAHAPGPDESHANSHLDVCVRPCASFCTALPKTDRASSPEGTSQKVPKRRSATPQIRSQFFDGGRDFLAK
jgi:hypothetical protein